MNWIQISPRWQPFVTRLKETLFVAVGVSAVMILGSAAVNVILLALNSWLGTSTCEVFTFERIFSPKFINFGVTILVVMSIIALADAVRFLPYFAGYEFKMNPRVYAFLMRFGERLERIVVSKYFKYAVRILVVLLALVVLVCFYGVIRGNLCI